MGCKCYSDVRVVRPENGLDIYLPPHLHNTPYSPLPLTCEISASAADFHLIPSSGVRRCVIGRLLCSDLRYPSSEVGPPTLVNLARVAMVTESRDYIRGYHSNETSTVITWGIPAPEFPGEVRSVMLIYQFTNLEVRWT